MKRRSLAQNVGIDQYVISPLKNGLCAAQGCAAELRRACKAQAIREVGRSCALPNRGRKSQGRLFRRTVIHESKRVRRIFERYLDTLVGRDNVYITKYEDMIDDFQSWLTNLLDNCQLTISSGLRQQLIQEAEQSRPTTEDRSRHMRQVTPGDHKRKLQQATIATLDASFAHILAAFGYSYRR